MPEQTVELSEVAARKLSLLLAAERAANERTRQFLEGLLAQLGYEDGEVRDIDLVGRKLVIVVAGDDAEGDGDDSTPTD